MKYFVKNGNEYKMKPQWGIYSTIVGFFALLTILSFTKAPDSSLYCWLLGMTIFLIISFLRRCFIIDLNQKHIKVRNGLFGIGHTILLDNLVGLTVHEIKQVGFITTNVSLIARFVNQKGKYRETQLVQAVSKKKIQNILNEIEEILGNEHQK
ncbi:hypothetical protein [Sphingobacterium sp.]|uniref:hypothetical protein n=1 Tax=Sphingobacterium sp. TaxID=341027 RepID=UPI0028A0291F|nr:hypothetical protein [Sphingobacterium sp.]